MIHNATLKVLVILLFIIGFQQQIFCSPIPKIDDPYGEANDEIMNDEYGEMNSLLNEDGSEKDSGIKYVTSLKDLSEFINGTVMDNNNHDGVESTLLLVVFDENVRSTSDGETSVVNEFIKNTKSFSTIFDLPLAISVNIPEVSLEYGVNSIQSKWRLYFLTGSKWISEKDGEKRKQRYPAEQLKESTIVEFAKSKWLPLVSQMTRESEKFFKFVNPPNEVLLIFNLKSGGEKNMIYNANRLRKVAKSFNKQFRFALIDWEDAKLTKHHTYLNTLYVELNPTNKRDFRLLVVKVGNQYYFDKEMSFSTESAIAFIEKFMAGKVVPVVHEEQKEMEEEEGMGEEGENQQQQEGGEFGEEL